MALIPIQDSIPITDTTGQIKLMKLIPAKIKSSDGAIIPKEAVEWKVLEPSFPSQKEPSGFNQYDVWLIFGIALLVIVIVYLFKRRQNKKNR